MFLLLDLIYLFIMPFIVLSAISSRLRGHPPRSGWKARLGAGKTFPKTKDRILLHAVSVGEVNAIRGLVENLTHKGRQLVISVTTDTGIARAEELFGKDHPIVRYPLDFSWSVNTFLNRMNPSIIVLVELEVWPNMLRISKERNIPVVVVNGRLSDRSYKRYKLVSRLL
ncbi:MAG: glycosyltransferase N-terminal domain-containing protein, partial [Phycisphaerales bacterium]|nr:glycosyltransferase N-terminal domain-containing protein [Phycisphaerales bacterium]